MARDMLHLPEAVPDPSAEKLDEIRRRHDLIDDPAGWAFLVVERLKASAGDVPRLLRIADELLGRHHPNDTVQPSFCAECRERWPCGDYLIVAEALAGKDGAS